MCYLEIHIVISLCYEVHHVTATFVLINSHMSRERFFCGLKICMGNRNPVNSHFQIDGSYAAHASKLPILPANNEAHP